MILGSQRFTCTLRKLIPRYEPEVARVLRIVAVEPLREGDLEARGRAEPGAGHQHHVAPVRAGDAAREWQTEADAAGLAGPAAIGAPERRERAVDLGG